jgi:arsenite methyltransferase
MSTSNVKKVVREKYGQAALRVKSGAGNCCGDRASALGASCDPITSNLYGSAQKGELPETAIKASKEPMNQGTRRVFFLTLRA